MRAAGSSTINICSVQLEKDKVNFFGSRLLLKYILPFFPQWIQEAAKEEIILTTFAGLNRCPLLGHIRDLPSQSSVYFTPQ